MEDNKQTNPLDMFTTLPSHSQIGALEAEESAKFGTLNLGSLGGFSSGPALNSDGKKYLAPAPSSSIYSTPVGFNPKTRNLDRYKDHPAYSRLGFSVFRDNDTYYNNNTSWTGDFVRAFRWHNFGAGFKQGFISNYEGFSTIARGDMLNPLAMDREKGRIAEEAAARAMSTRGGWGQSMVNIPYNLNYTLGIVASIAAEDLALALMAPETFGGSLLYAGARTIKGGARAIKSLYRTVKQADNIKDVVKLKDIYDMSKAGLGAIPRAFVPNTGKLAYGAFRTSDKATDFGRATDAMSELFTKQGFGAAYRDFRMVSLAVDESQVEAAGVRNQMEDKLIEEYVNTYGRLPEGAEMQNIISTAQEASAKDYFANLPIIYATNAITFNSLTLPYSLTGNNLRVASKGGKHLFAKTVGTKVEAEILSTRQLIGKTLTDKDYAKYALGVAFNYMKANLAEGFQELYQEGTSATLEDYYTNKYFTGGDLFSKSFSDSVKKGLGDQISQQGLEAFLGGFLGGAGVQSVSGGIQQLRVGAAAVSGKFSPDFKEQYQKRRDKDLQTLQNMEASIIKHSDNILAALAPEFTQFKVQNDNNLGLLEAAELNDRKAFEDLKDDSLFNHIVNLSASGVMDSFIEAMENHKLLSEEEMKQALNVQSKEEGDQLVDSIVSRARGIAKMAIMVEQRYQNPYTGMIFDMTKDSAERKKSMLSYMAWEEAKKDFIFSYYKSGRNLDRLDEIFNAASSDPAIASMMSSDFAVLFSTKSGRSDKEGKRLYEQALEAEIDKLSSDIKGAELALENIEASEDTAENKANQKRVAQDKLSKATKKKALLEAYSNIVATILESGNIEETIADPKVKAEFEKAIDDYLDFLASGTNSLVDKEKTAKLKNQLLDYFRLSEDRVKFNSAAAALSDPSQFGRWYDVHKAQLQSAYEKYLKEAYNRAKTAVEKEHRQELIKELESIGVVISAEPEVDENGNVTRASDLERFIQLGDVPTKFFSLNEEDTDINGNVIEGTETWNEIQDILDKFALLDEEFAKDLEELRNKKTEAEETTEEETPVKEAPAETPPAEEVETPEEPVSDEEEIPTTTTTDNVYSIEELEQEFGNVVYNGKKGGLIQALQKMFRKANSELAQEDRFTDINDWLNGPGKIEAEPIILRLREAVEETTVEPVETTPEIAFEEPAEPVSEQPKRKGRTLSQRLASLAKTKNIETIQKQKEKAAEELSKEESVTFIEAANQRIEELEAAKAKTSRQEEMKFEPADVEVSDKEFSEEATAAVKNAKEGGEIAEEDDDIDLGCK